MTISIIDQIRIRYAQKELEAERTQPALVTYTQILDNHYEITERE